jgi:hypothetical protein
LQSFGDTLLLLRGYRFHGGFAHGAGFNFYGGDRMAARGHTVDFADWGFLMLGENTVEFQP